VETWSIVRRMCIPKTILRSNLGPNLAIFVPTPLSGAHGRPLDARSSIRRGVKGFFSPIEKAKLIGPLQGKA